MALKYYYNKNKRNNRDRYDKAILLGFMALLFASVAPVAYQLKQNSDTAVADSAYTKEQDACEVTYIDVKDGLFLFDTDNDLKTAEVIATSKSDSVNTKNAAALFGHEGEKQTVAKWKGMTQGLHFTFFEDLCVRAK